MKKPSDKRPGLNILARYAKGDKDELKYWSKFIENNDECRDDVALLGKLALLLDAIDFKRTVPASAEMATSIFRSYKSGRGTDSQSTAHLYFDSRAVPLPQGVRSSLSSQYRLKYKTETGQIEISVVPVYPGRFEVTGRYEGESRSAAAEVQLKGRKTLSGRFDEYGFFSFPAVNPGSYCLSFRTDQGPVFISHLEL